MTIEQEILFDMLNNPNDSFYENVLSDFLDEQGVDHDFRKPLHNNLVTKLKPYHKKCLDVWANYWFDISICTKPTNESRAEQYFCDIYKELDLKMPKKIIWFNNPFEMCFQISNLSNLNFQIRNQVWDQTWNEARYKISDQIWSQLYNKMFNKIWNKVWNKINNQLRNLLLYEVFYGQHDAHWLAFYSYCMQVLRIETAKQFVVLFMLLSQEVNWWFPTEKTVYATKKPKECVFEKRKFVKLVYQDNYTII
jgi:hypothetical protein